MTDNRTLLVGSFVQPTQRLQVPDGAADDGTGEVKLRDVKPQTRDEYNDKLKELTGKKAGTASRYGDAFSSNKSEALISHIVKTTKYEPELQACRWLSTIALQYLLGKDPTTVEVQCLYDEQSETVFIAANNNKHTESLVDGDWAKWIIDDRADPPKASEPQDKFDYRHARHAAEILLETGRYAEALKFLKHVPDIDSCQSCKSRKITSSNYTEIADKNVDIATSPDEARFLKVLRAKNFRYVTMKQDPMHAESKILQAWREHYEGKTKQSHNLFIAGVMRPCLACYYRLQRHKLELADGTPPHTLNIKARPGPLWFSKSGLCGATGEDHEKIAAHMEESKQYYLSIFKKKGKNDIVIEEVHYDYDTDSGSEDTLPEYAYTDGREKISRPGRADHADEAEWVPPDDLDVEVPTRKERVRTRSAGGGARPVRSYVERSDDEDEIEDDRGYGAPVKASASKPPRTSSGRTRNTKRKHDSDEETNSRLANGDDEETFMDTEDDSEGKRRADKKKKTTER